jgi:hypothetical protein
MSEGGTLMFHFLKREESTEKKWINKNVAEKPC